MSRRTVKGGISLRVGGRFGGRRGLLAKGPEAMVIRERISPESLVLQGAIVTNATDTKPPPFISLLQNSGSPASSAKCSYS